MKGSSIGWAIALVMAIFAVALLFGLWPKGQNFEQATGLDEWCWYQTQKLKFSDEKEKVLIEQWIITSGLNKYGDPADTIYVGGTPLFNEATGERLDRYDYILKNHPDRPWLKK